MGPTNVQSPTASFSDQSNDDFRPCSNTKITADLPGVFWPLSSIGHYLFSIRHYSVEVNKKNLLYGHDKRFSVTDQMYTASVKSILLLDSEARLLQTNMRLSVLPEYAWDFSVQFKGQAQGACSSVSFSRSGTKSELNQVFCK